MDFFLSFPEIGNRNCSGTADTEREWHWHIFNSRCNMDNSYRNTIWSTRWMLMRAAQKGHCALWRLRVSSWWTVDWSWQTGAHIWLQRDGRIILNLQDWLLSTQTKESVILDSQTWVKNGFWYRPFHATSRSFVYVLTVRLIPLFSNAVTPWF